MFVCCECRVLSGRGLCNLHARARACRLHLTCQSHKLRTHPSTDVSRNWRTPNTTITEGPFWTRS
jgi:hypothetical protein